MPYPKKAHSNTRGRGQPKDIEAAERETKAAAEAEEQEFVDDLKAARALAIEFFAPDSAGEPRLDLTAPPPTSEMIWGIYARLWLDTDDEDERNEAREDLRRAKARAVEIFGTPSVDDVFRVYDLIFCEEVD